MFDSKSFKITPDGTAILDEDFEVDEEQFFNKEDPQAAARAEELKSKDALRKSFVAPAGAFGARCPPLLDARRIRYGITDGAFKVMPVYDRVFVKQIPEWVKGTYGNSMLVMPESAKARELNETPLGILVGAGCKALDELRSNGIDLGHRVRFVKNVVYRMRVDTIGGQHEYVLVMHSGDIVGSEDLGAQMISGTADIAYDEAEETHRYHTPLGIREPQVAWMSDDQ